MIALADGASSSVVTHSKDAGRFRRPSAALPLLPNDVWGANRNHRRAVGLEGKIPFVIPRQLRIALRELSPTASLCERSHAVLGPRKCLAETDPPRPTRLRRPEGRLQRNQGLSRHIVPISHTARQCAYLRQSLTRFVNTGSTLLALLSINGPISLPRL